MIYHFISIGSLQVAPIDALERFVETDVFTWVDKEGTFIVSRFLSNPNQVEIVNSNVKELLKLGITYLSDTLLSEKNEPKNVMELRRDRDKRWKEIVGSTSNIFIENLKLQPSEAVDKFIVESFLPSVDKSMSPLLSNLLANPEQVDAATRQIKEVIKVTTQNLVSSKSSNTQNPLEVGTTKITDELNRQVDKYGEWTSSLIQDWNEFIADVNMTVKIESISVRFFFIDLRLMYVYSR